MTKGFKLLEKADLDQIKSDKSANKLLDYIKKHVHNETGPDFELQEFIDNLGICYQQADGFVLTDGSRKNYSVPSILSHIDRTGEISITELTNNSI
ncbi:gp298 [Sphingomonas phage PAU]|uniref:gp298 n=1 Tax=Sphingomonas phage PAU TaxID=1150991 RepID=UPI00025734A9|nr:gp298 [Sphingomonas phage PAU]AFF28295.1 gp298 [Sphingomonas phage PAU]